ncbi:MAG: hypothetical protein WAN47_08040 [Nitrosotalea sp.]
MKSLTLYIIMAISIGVIVTFGAIVSFSHIFNPSQPYQPISENTPPSMLSLDVSVNSTQIKAGQGIAMDIVLDNTSPNVLTLRPQHNWPVKQWSILPCLFHLPFGMALFEGNYSVENMTEGKRLAFYKSGVYMCKTIGIVDYVFQPSSNQAVIETYNSTNYQVPMQYHVAFDGYYNGQKFQTLMPGVYTLVGDDEWGHLSINHFTVTNSTS